MIKKKREEYQNVEGQGRPFDMNATYGFTTEKKNDGERNVPVLIKMNDLNGQTYDKGMPKNFHKKAGRVLPSFTDYWSPSEIEDLQENEFDIE